MAAHRAPKPDSGQLISSSDRRSKHPVRTTLTLSPDTVEAIPKLAKALAISRKEVLNALCERFQIGLDEPFIQAVIEGVKTEASPSTTIRRTYVLTRFAFDFLNQAAEDLRVDRNRLMEQLVHSWIVLRVAPYSEQLKKAAECFASATLTLNDLFDEIHSLLGVDDELNIFTYRLSLFMENIPLIIKSHAESGSFFTNEELRKLVKAYLY
jgi:hypothetical protein